MKQTDRLILAARIFDAVYQMTLMQEKDNNPDHWKTINGAHVHVDENGNYDGGAGGKFNGNHHYGKGGTKKAKVEAKNKARKAAVKELRSWQNTHHRAEYRAGESFKDWQRRDDIDYDKDDSKAEKGEILIELSENWEKLYNEERTPENLVNRVNEQYEEMMKRYWETLSPEEKEYDYDYNPLEKEAEQRERWESMKQKHETEEYSRKKAEEYKKTREKEKQAERHKTAAETEEVPF